MNLWNLWTDRNLWTDMNLWNLTLGETEQVRLKKYRLNSSGCLNVKKIDDDKCWYGYRKTGTPILLWWGCKLV